MASGKSRNLDEENAVVLAHIIVDDDTPDPQKVEAINKLLESKRDENFFNTMFEQLLSFGACPECGHENHWAIPENDLNQIGWVTAEKDERVKVHTTVDDCEQYQEACGKKKVTF